MLYLGQRYFVSAEKINLPSMETPNVPSYNSKMRLNFLVFLWSRALVAAIIRCCYPGYSAALQQSETESPETECCRS